MHRKKSRGSNTHIEPNRPQKKSPKNRPRRSLRNTQGRIHQEDINIVNIYAPNIGAPKYIKKIFRELLKKSLEDLKKDTDGNKIIVGDFNTPCQKWIDLPNKISMKILLH